MKEFMRSRQIDTLFHFTRANNLPNIFQYGLLPKESLLDNEIDAEFNDRYRYDGCEDALCASLEFPNYKMFYSLRTDNPDVDWAVIKLDARILLDYDCNGVQREHNKKLNNGLPILHKVPPKRDYGRYFCIMAEKGGTSHGGLTEKSSPFFMPKNRR